MEIECPDCNHKIDGQPIVEHLKNSLKNIWYPINTAPTDIRILVVDEPGSPWDMALVIWDRETLDWREANGDVMYPTHWMPLPEPPEKGD